MNSQPLEQLLVFDGCEPCPYLPGRTARMPLRLPTRRLSGEELDRHLAGGDRRTGNFLYRTACSGCRACIPLRVNVSQFRPSRSQRRAQRQGDRLLRVSVGPPQVDQRRVALFNLHRRQRALAGDQGELDSRRYRAFLVDSCCDSIEVCYHLGDELVAVAIADRGEQAMSAVYCYYDSRHGRLGLGTYSILKQIELCRELGLTWLYLGLYIPQSPHLSYKADFRPHQRLIEGRWLAVGEGGKKQSECRMQNAE